MFSRMCFSTLLYPKSIFYGSTFLYVIKRLLFHGKFCKISKRNKIESDVSVSQFNVESEVFEKNMFNRFLLSKYIKIKINVSIIF